MLVCIGSLVADVYLLGAVFRRALVDHCYIALLDLIGFELYLFACRMGCFNLGGFLSPRL
jgi:hypothetical protein